MRKNLSGVLADDAGRHMRWDLQLFAESASGGESGEGASVSADQATESGNDPLDSLGIPKEKLERYRSIKGMQPKEDPVGRSEDGAQPVQDDGQFRTNDSGIAGLPSSGSCCGRSVDPKSEISTEQAAAPEEPSQAEGQDPDAEWDGILRNPEFNRRIQDIVQKRVAGMKASLDSLAPVIETLGQKYGMDVSDISKMDLGELAKHVTEDAETGAIAEAQEQVSRRHFEELVRQAEILREKIPNFDLQRELQDPRFARMTAPGGGWTVEQAFNAVHHDALLRIAAEQAARQAARALSNSVQAGKNLPAENGSVQRSATGMETKLYSQMSPEERRRYKEQLKNGSIHF